MKTKKILQTLDSSFNDAIKCMGKHNKTLETFLKEIKAAEKVLLKQLKKESKKSRKKKLKKKLGIVELAYMSLG